MNKKALDRPNDVWKHVSQWLDKLDKFNRFELSMNLDFEYVVGKDDDVNMDATGHLESHTELVELGKNECGWQLNLKYPDYTNRSGSEEPFEIPFRVLGWHEVHQECRHLHLLGTRKNEYDLSCFQIRFLPWCFQ
jgi:hypothetical protein